MGVLIGLYLSFSYGIRLELVTIPLWFILTRVCLILILLIERLTDFYISDIRTVLLPLLGQLYIMIYLLAAPSLVFCVVFCRSLFVLFLLIIVFSVLWFYDFWLPLWYLQTFCIFFLFCRHGDLHLLAWHIIYSKNKMPINLQIVTDT